MAFLGLAEEHHDAAEPALADTERPRPLQAFSETTSLRDDWLHRGYALIDMDLYQ